MTTWLNLERLAGNDLGIPNYATEYSAGLDFGACLKRGCLDRNKIEFFNSHSGERHKQDTKSVDPTLIIKPNETVLIPLGFKCEFNSGHVMQLYIRSSVGLRGLSLANGVGIIDSDYRGELFACVCNRTSDEIRISHGQKIVQAVLTKFDKAIIGTVDVEHTTRGDGGFGSTDKIQ